MQYGLSEAQGRTLCRSRTEITCSVSGPNEFGRYDLSLVVAGETFREKTGIGGEGSREGAIWHVNSVLEIAVAHHGVDVPGTLCAADVVAITDQMLAGADTVETAILFGA